MCSTFYYGVDNSVLIKVVCSTIYYCVDNNDLTSRVCSTIYYDVDNIVQTSRVPPFIMVLITLFKRHVFPPFIMVLLLLLLKNIGNATPGEGDWHPISPKTPAPHYKPIEEKKRKGK